MGHGAITRPEGRAWTLELRPGPSGTVVTCPRCGRLPATPESAATQAVVVTHLAQHARSETLPGHLRTCQCGETGCQWHQRHRGCDGPISLLLMRSAHGRIWRLADACRACAAATRHAAAVHEPHGGASDATPSNSALASDDEALQTAEEEATWWDDEALYG